MSTQLFHRSVLAAIAVSACLSGLPVTGQTTADAELRIETVPYPAGFTPPGPQVSYTAPNLSAMRRDMSYDGEARSYYLHVPASGAGAPRPVIILLHGAQRTGASMIDMWRAVADAEGAVLLAPNSLGPSWSPAEDPPNLLMTMLRDANAQTSLDPARVYLFGHSAGARLATLYGNRVGGPWRAVATHGGTLDPAAIAPAQAVPPMLHLLGADDHLFPGRAAQASAKALAEAGHKVELRMISGHSHWYYAIGPYLSTVVWAWWEAQQ